MRPKVSSPLPKTFDLLSKKVQDILTDIWIFVLAVELGDYDLVYAGYFESAKAGSECLMHHNRVIQLISLLGASVTPVVLSVACSAADLGPTFMNGSIDSHYGIVMEIKSANNKFTGSYRYATSKTSLTLDGTIDGAKVLLNERDPKGKVTGSFIGTLVGGKRFFGTWSDAKKTKTLPFIVAVETDATALENGKDGIIITQKTRKISKPKRNGEATDPAVVTYPIVAQNFLPAAIASKVQTVLSTKNVLKESPDDMAAAIKGGEFWLNEVGYTVNYNKNYLVDADFNRDGCGAYPDGSIYHVLVDLKTGSQVVAKNAFNQASMPKLKELIKAKMKQEVQDSYKEFAKSPDELSALKGQLKEPTEVPTEVLNNFTVSDKGLTFAHDWGFPHVLEALQPEGHYFFSFADMKPFLNTTGPLWQFAK
jgi:hypothetical protein